MASFPGGSAWAMVRDIAEGYFLVTERTFRAFGRPELDKISFELERHMREVRGDQAPLDDLSAIQNRNRRIQRLNTAMLILRSFRQRSRI
jgi:hypothetical protein